MIFFRFPLLLSFVDPRRLFCLRGSNRSKSRPTRGRSLRPRCPKQQQSLNNGYLSTWGVHVLFALNSPRFLFALDSPQVHAHRGGADPRQRHGNSSGRRSRGGRQRQPTHPVPRQRRLRAGGEALGKYIVQSSRLNASGSASQPVKRSF